MRYLTCLSLISTLVFVGCGTDTNKKNSDALPSKTGSAESIIGKWELFKAINEYSDEEIAFAAEDGETLQKVEQVTVAAGMAIYTFASSGALTVELLDPETGEASKTTGGFKVSNSNLLLVGPDGENNVEAIKSLSASELVLSSQEDGSTSTLFFRRMK